MVGTIYIRTQTGRSRTTISYMQISNLNGVVYITYNTMIINVGGWISMIEVEKRYKDASDRYKRMQKTMYVFIDNSYFYSHFVAVSTDA